MKACIMQPYFMPWGGYFSRAYASDLFVILDDVQFEKGGYTNRVKTIDGSWITVPTNNRLGMKINDVMPSGPWKASDKILVEYMPIPGIGEDGISLAREIALVVRQCAGSIADLDISIINRIMGCFDIKKPKIIRSSELGIETTKNQRLIDICNAVRADTYLYGTGAINYMDIELFNSNGITPKLFHSNMPKFSIMEFIYCYGIKETEKIIRSDINAIR